MHYDFTGLTVWTNRWLSGEECLRAVRHVASHVARPRLNRTQGNEKSMGDSSWKSFERRKFQKDERTTGCNHRGGDALGLAAIGAKPLGDFGNGMTRSDDKAFTRFQVTANAQEIGQEMLWRNASKHSFGAGLETGIPSFEPARKAKRYLKKHSLHDAAQGLENIVVGIYRPCASDGVFGVCRRCAKDVVLGCKHDLCFW